MTRGAGQGRAHQTTHVNRLRCVSYRVYDGSDRAENCSKKAVYCKDQSSTAAMEGRCRFPTHETQMALATEARSLRLPALHRVCVYSALSHLHLASRRPIAIPLDKRSGMQSWRSFFSLARAISIPALGVCFGPVLRRALRSGAATHGPLSLAARNNDWSHSRPRRCTRRDHG